MNTFTEPALFLLRPTVLLSICCCIKQVLCQVRNRVRYFAIFIIKRISYGVKRSELRSRHMSSVCLDIRTVTIAGSANSLISNGQWDVAESRRKLRLSDRPGYPSLWVNFPVTGFLINGAALQVDRKIDNNHKRLFICCLWPNLNFYCETRILLCVLSCFRDITLWKKLH